MPNGTFNSSKLLPYMMKNVTEKNIFSWKDINARMVLCNNYIVCTEFMKTMGFIICMKSLRDGILSATIKAVINLLSLLTL